MNYFVYYSRGGCNYGDHSWGLEEFKTLVEAEAFANEQRREDDDCTIEIIEGKSVTK